MASKLEEFRQKLLEQRVRLRELQKREGITPRASPSPSIVASEPQEPALAVEQEKPLAEIHSNLEVHTTPKTPSH